MFQINKNPTSTGTWGTHASITDLLRSKPHHHWTKSAIYRSLWPGFGDVAIVLYPAPERII